MKERKRKKLVHYKKKKVGARKTEGEGGYRIWVLSKK